MLAASGAPILGNRDFGLALSNGRPDAPAAAVAVSAASANIPLGTCMLLVQPPSIDLPLRLDTNGSGSAAVPIPNVAGLRGV